MYFIIRSSLPGGFSYGEEFRKNVALLCGRTQAEMNFNEVAIELC